MIAIIADFGITGAITPTSGVEGERMPGVEKHRVVPRPEGVIGIRDSGDGHTPVTSKACEVVVVV